MVSVAKGRTFYRRGFPYLLGGVWEWVSVLLAFLTLEVSFYSIEKAEWITPQPPLTFILILAFLTAWLLVKSRMPAVLTGFLALLLGTMITAWQASSFIPAKDMGFLANLAQWWQIILTTSPNEGTIHFATFLILFTWLTGYCSVWFILRKHNAWVTVLLGGITILVNLSNLTEEYHRFFFFYLIFTLLLLGGINLIKKVSKFQKSKIKYPQWGLFYLVTLLILVSMLVTLATWHIPQFRADELEALVSRKTTWRKSLEESHLNLFAEVPSKKLLFTGTRQRALHFSDSFHRGENVHFVITSEHPRYWRTQAYDICTAWGWRSSPTSLLTEEHFSPLEKESSLREELTYSVETRIKTDVLLTTGEFSSANVPALAQRLAPLVYNINLTNPAYDSFLPQDAAFFAQSLRKAKEKGAISSLADIKNLLPQGLLLSGLGKERYPPTEANYEMVMEQNWLTGIEVTRRQAGKGDIIAVVVERSLKTNQTYTVTARISTATHSDLVSAKDDYPTWVTDHYLQLPTGLPDRVPELAEITTGAFPSAYEKAVAVKIYLSQFPYSEGAAPPPEKADGVDYFLFIHKTGNCGYFASAMAILLRSSGVPARVCTGYLPGEWDTASGRFVLKAKHYHAWVEVYFPGYGWIEFEATPSVTGGVAGSAGGTGPGQRAISLTPRLGGTGTDEEFMDYFMEEGETGTATRDTATPGVTREVTGSAGGTGPGQGEISPTPRPAKKEGISPEDTRRSSKTERVSKDTSERRPSIRVEMEAKLPLTIAMIFILLLIVALVSAFYGWLWHFTGTDYGSEVYAKMYLLASWAGLRPTPQQTPLEYGASLATAFPLQTASILNIIQIYQKSYYGQRKGLAPHESEHLEQSWQNVYTAFVKRLLRLR